MGSCTSSKNPDCLCANSNVYEIGANRDISECFYADI